MLLGKGLRPIHVVAAIFIVRLLSVFIVQTWYVPDEYWQSLEVAHHYAFGYGALTWEWKQGIRSYLYPSVIAVFYMVLKYTGLDYPEVVIFLPRILQAAISTVADYSFYKWTGYRRWALFLNLTSWFWFYTSSRTLLQTLETSLVAVALSLFPFKDGLAAYYNKESPKWIWLAVVCAFVRPTSVPIWAVLGAYNLVTTNQGRLRLLVRTYIPILLIAGGALVVLDSYFHGSFIVTPWEFFKFNILHDIASFYGKHPWYWYIVIGLPAVLGISTLPVLWAIVNILRRPKENRIGAVLLSAVVLHVALHSFTPHKEFRFLLPLLPILLYLAQDVIVPWSRKAKKWQLYTAAIMIFIANMVPALYLGVVHQAGTLRVMPLLRDGLQDNNSSVAFLMPCHSTPLYSHLHKNVSARYLDCAPPLPGGGRGHTHEAEAFFNNPARWWRAHYSSRQEPALVVLFDRLRGRLEPLLAPYRLQYEVPHTQFPEGEVGKSVLVYKKVVNRSPPVATPPDEVV